MLNHLQQVGGNKCRFVAVVWCGRLGHVCAFARWKTGQTAVFPSWELWARGLHSSVYLWCLRRISEARKTYQRSERIPVSVVRPKREHVSKGAELWEGERERATSSQLSERKWKEKSTERRLFSGCRVFCRYSLLSGYTLWRWRIVGLVVAPPTKRSSQDILPEYWRLLAVSWERDTPAVCHGKRLWLRPRSKRGVLCWPKESSAEARAKGSQRTSLFSEEKEEIRHFSACWTPR